MISRLAVSDIPEMLALMEIYCAESGYEMTFDHDLSRIILEMSIERPDVCPIIAKNEAGTIVGGALMEVSRMWSVELWGYVQGFWISPEARGTKAARLLAAELVTYATDAGATYIFNSATAGLSPSATKQFVNLFAKFGFEAGGSILTKRII